MLSNPKIYLASPFFNAKELETYAKVITFLRSCGCDVFVPREHEVPNAWSLTESRWGAEVYKIDERAIQECDIVLVLNHGMYSDSGTAWEAGYAGALDKYVYQVLCGDANTVYSLMMINSADAVFSLDSLLSYAKRTPLTLMDYFSFPTVEPRQK